MTTAMLAIGLGFLFALVGTWLVAHRAAKAGALATSERVWESCTTFLLIVPSLVEQAIDEGRAWLRSARSRVLGSHQSLSWLIIGSSLGTVAWAGIAFLAAGHHATERFGVQALGAHLSETFDVEHLFIDIHNPV